MARAFALALCLLGLLGAAQAEVNPALAELVRIQDANTNQMDAAMDLAHAAGNEPGGHAGGMVMFTDGNGKVHVEKWSTGGRKLNNAKWGGKGYYQQPYYGGSSASSAASSAASGGGGGSSAAAAAAGGGSSAAAAAAAAASNGGYGYYPGGGSSSAVAASAASSGGGYGHGGRGHGWGHRKMLQA